MTIADSVNGSYELIGGFFMLVNCVKLFMDKELRGTTLISAIFFCSWGYWNLYYYPLLSQWMSTIGASFLTIFNTAWIFMAIYYSYERKHKYNINTVRKIQSCQIKS